MSKTRSLSKFSNQFVMQNESKQHLYIFGYCTPNQWLLNEDRGWNDENSCAFFIIANSQKEALQWGREVAEILVGRLFDLDPRFSERPSWKEANFANWIEDEPLSRFSKSALTTIPIIQMGEMPGTILS